ncbi:toluene tolerance protein Ttg2D [Leptospira inadai serovar Lyme]|uniref:Toluene tolerance protein Ttg2D n=1 Tax=Leptospira inadai serovar Lyme TaxID=293084 RepID=A0ABX4YJ10_9LEPT|nr:toluene tolerance protein Ttg2D [Leptospira inadai serovar Lyme]
MFLISILLFANTTLFSEEAQPTTPPPTETAVSPEESSLSAVKKLVGFIRYKKNDKALALIHVGRFSESLIGASKFSSAERKEFEDAIAEYIVNKAFPIAVKYFDKIDITYEKPILKDKRIRIGSSILYKGSDQVSFAWILSEIDGNWYITDFETEGKLATDINRTKNIEPSLKKNGVKGTIALVQKAAKN